MTRYTRVVLNQPVRDPGNPDKFAQFKEYEAPKYTAVKDGDTVTLTGPYGSLDIAWSAVLYAIREPIDLPEEKTVVTKRGKK